VLSLSDVGSHAAAGGDMRSSTNAGVGQPYTSDPLVANSRLAVKLGREARERRMEPLRRYRARQARFGSVSETIALRFLASRGRFIFSPERIGIPSPEGRAADLEGVGDVLRASTAMQGLRDKPSDLSVAALACLPEFSNSPLGLNLSYLLPCRGSANQFRARTGSSRPPGRSRGRRVR
jgi:hypothetical protein